MMPPMRQYLDFLSTILSSGIDRADRTGVGRCSIFGYQMRYPLSEGFPLLTTKSMAVKAIVHELLWFLRGDTNIRYLVQHGVKIWNEWPFQDYLKAHGLEERYPRYSLAWKEQMDLFVARIVEDDNFAAQWGDLGPVYGKQWRRWEGNDGKTFDQIAWAIDQIRHHPESSRTVISAWNVADIHTHTKYAPPLCHTLFQFLVLNGKLCCQLYQRSGDAFLGVPFNIASYALLTCMIAQVCDLPPGDFVHTLGDAHLYFNHKDQAKEQLARTPRPLPRLRLNSARKEIDDFVFEDIAFDGYDPHPVIKAAIAV